MARAQIYLSDAELALLDRAERTTGASRSELIRRAVRSTYGEPDKEERLKALRQAKGIWRDRTFTGAEYVDAVRGNLDDRLRRLGFD